MGTVKRFFKGFDRYAKGVAPMYKHSGSFETSCGGICSIISFVILAWWFITEIYSQFYNPAYDISKSTSLVQAEDGTYQTYNLKREELLTTVRIQSSNEDITDDEIYRYFYPLWV